MKSVWDLIMSSRGKWTRLERNQGGGGGLKACRRYFCMQECKRFSVKWIKTTPFKASMKTKRWGLVGEHATALLQGLTAGIQEDFIKVPSPKQVYLQQKEGWLCGRFDIKANCTWWQIICFNLRAAADSSSIRDWTRVEVFREKTWDKDREKKNKIKPVI